MLVLFDIDGTLISSGEAGTRSLNRAFYTLFGIKDAFREISMAGKTDIQIMKEGLRFHGIPITEENLNAVVQSYLQFLETEIENPWKRMMPGVIDILEYLKENECHLGLLTGNLERGARIKLHPFGLNPYFPTGAFGSDHEDRNMLLPIALKRFSSNGVSFSPEKCIIVGDTPRDVQCAKVHGARCIGVCTGPYDAYTLQKAGADLVVPTLTEMQRLKEYLNYLKGD
jgi:phosphoglycolate phosphatase-like HAD superfamily hydrolase